MALTPCLLLLLLLSILLLQEHFDKTYGPTWHCIVGACVPVASPTGAAAEGSPPASSMRVDAALAWMRPAVALRCPRHCRRAPAPSTFIELLLLTSLPRWLAACCACRRRLQSGHLPREQDVLLRDDGQEQRAAVPVRLGQSAALRGRRCAMRCQLSAGAPRIAKGGQAMLFQAVPPRQPARNASSLNTPPRKMT